MAVFIVLGGFGIYFLMKYRRRMAKHVLAFALGFVTFVAAAFFAEKMLTLVRASSEFPSDPWHRALMLGGLLIPLGILVAGAILKNMGERERRAALSIFCLFVLFVRQRVDGRGSSSLRYFAIDAVYGSV